MHRIALLMAASVGSALVPESIGVVGVGTISSAAVRGLCRSDASPDITLSPRNAAKAKALEQEFETVRIATNNQAVVDACDCVLLAVLPGQAEQVCEPLNFREGQLVISLIAGVPLSDIQKWCGPAECALACPLPAIYIARDAHRHRAPHQDLDRGRLVEEGAPTKLIAQNGAFAEMVRASRSRSAANLVAAAAVV